MKNLFLSLILILVSTPAFAVTFNPSTGTGSITTTEMNSAYGWSQYKGIQFICHQIEHYTATVQYTNTMGNIVTQTIDIPVTTYTTVRVAPSMTGFDFVGYGVPNKMNRLPLTGEQWVIEYAGRPTLSKILSISAAPTTTNYGVLGFNGVYGYKRFY